MRTFTSAKNLHRQENLSRTGPGLTLVDTLLEPVGRRHQLAAVNAALDLRLLMASSADGGAIICAFFRLRDVIDDDLHPICQLLQNWLETKITPSVGTDEFDPPHSVKLGLDVAGYEELCASCKSAARREKIASAEARVRFIYLPAIGFCRAAVGEALAA